jgi:hypothetical protein
MELLTKLKCVESVESIATLVVRGVYTGHVMHHQFSNWQLYAVSTLYLCVLYLSENKQRLLPLTA